MLLRFSIALFEIILALTIFTDPSKFLSSIDSNYGLVMLICNLTTEGGNPQTFCAKKAFEHLSPLVASHNVMNNSSLSWIFGNALLKWGKEPDGIALIRQIPGIAQTVINSAEIAQVYGSPALAIERLKLAKQIDSNLNVKNFEKRGFEAIDSKQYSEAIDWFSLIIAVKPYQLDTWSQLAFWSQYFLIRDSDPNNQYTENYNRFVRVNNGNYVINGSFNADRVGWSIYQSDSAQAVFRIEAEPDISYAYVRGEGDGYHGGWLQILSLSNSGEFRYKVSVKTINKSDLLVRPLYWENVSPNLIGHYSDYTIQGDSEWRSYESVIQLSKNQTIALYPILVQGHGEVWFTDVELERITNER